MARRKQLLKKARRALATLTARLAVGIHTGSARREIRAGPGSGGYYGAKQVRLFSDWIASTLSADAELLPDREDLVARSRELVRNNAYARGVLRTMVTEIVGRGITPQPAPEVDHSLLTKTQAKSFKQSMGWVWRRWRRQAHAPRSLKTFEKVQEQVLWKVFEDGDVFVHFVASDKPGRDYDLALELIESHRVRTPIDRNLANRDIRDGIELDRFGHPVAIWVEVADPSNDRFGKPRTSIDFDRLPLYDEIGRPVVLHIYHQLRPGQSRGEPLFAPVLSLFKHMGDFVSAEVVAKKIEACLTVILQREEDEGDIGADEAEEDGRVLKKLHPGAILEAPAGVTAQTINPTRPGPNFKPFVEAMLRAMAHATGVPYEVLFSAYAGMNYSNARTALIAARRGFQVWQDFLIEELCNPVYCRLQEEAWQRDELEGVDDFVADQCALQQVVWQPHAWPWVDPAKEVKSTVDAIEANLTTKARVCAANGEDWEQVFAQRAEELAREKELGLESAAPALGAAGAVPERAGDDDDDDDEVEGVVESGVVEGDTDDEE